MKVLYVQIVSSELDEKQNKERDLKVLPIDIKQKYLAFLEYLMMNGLLDDIDFFDQKIYDEIERELLNKESLMTIQIH